MNITTEMPVSLTESAIRQVRKLMADPSFNTAQKLRIGVKGGGCSGMSYVLGFDEAKNPEDREFMIENIPVVIDEFQASAYLQGMVIDWDEGLNNRGFVFKNPKATGTCGCGSSFSV
jgi:iron-sulfur cluster assembly protein